MQHLDGSGAWPSYILDAWFLKVNWLVCITETECVYCAVRTGSLYAIQANFRSKMLDIIEFECFQWQCRLNVTLHQPSVTHSIASKFPVSVYRVTCDMLRPALGHRRGHHTQQWEFLLAAIPIPVGPYEWFEEKGDTILRDACNHTPSNQQRLETSASKICSPYFVASRVHTMIWFSLQ
jgi:hypothetical protein